ncbi:hypothetical protein GCM10010112_30290 [Actinoplanes lobatus]|nr:hypothetical protein [Actinoplanes lobatus]MBB4748744.1 hypothetical protein [Actinoplanes lobatus]GGN67149.1 hypothetical protein GCM10010112_30290 [Actinoplanes lobatus]
MVSNTPATAAAIILLNLNMGSSHQLYALELLNCRTLCGLDECGGPAQSGGYGRNLYSAPEKGRGDLSPPARNHR